MTKRVTKRVSKTLVGQVILALVWSLVWLFSKSGAFIYLPNAVQTVAQTSNLSYELLLLLCVYFCNLLVVLSSLHALHTTTVRLELDRG